MGAPERTPVDELTQLQTSVEELRRRGEANSLQIDALQLEASRRARSWYRESATVIAVLALITSMIATGFTLISSYQERASEARTRLTSIVQQLNEIARRNAELAVQYGPDRAPINSSRGEVSVIAQEAIALMDEVEATTYEQLTVAEALSFVSQPAEAQRLARIVEQRTLDPAESLRALRLDAAITMQSGDAEGGRRIYTRALQIFDQPAYRGTAKFFRDTAAAQTELEWASIEYSQHQCDAARQHMNRAQTAVKLYQPTQIRELLMALSSAAEQMKDCS